MIDGGPSRVSQSRSRQAVQRAEPVRRQPEPQPAPEPEYAAPVRRQTSSSRRDDTPRGGRGWIKWVIIAVVIAAAAIAAWLFWSGQRGGVAIDSNKHQAVFFTNGQVYFGKLQSLNADYMRLTDVYYLQAPVGESGSSNPQETSSSDGNVQLIKLGSEIHGPEDEMIISKSQVLFYENLKADGKVSESIKQHKSGN